MVNAGTMRMGRKGTASGGSKGRGLFRMTTVVPLREHTALEQTCMLEGSRDDAQGSCGAGDFVWRISSSALPSAPSHSPARDAPLVALACCARRCLREARDGGSRRSDQYAELQLRKSGTAFKASRQVRPFYS